MYADIVWFSLIIIFWIYEMEINLIDFFFSCKALKALSE